MSSNIEHIIHIMENKNDIDMDINTEKFYQMKRELEEYSYYLNIGYSELNITNEVFDTFTKILNENKFEGENQIRIFAAFDLIELLLTKKNHLDKVDDIMDICEVCIQRLDESIRDKYNIRFDLLKVRYNTLKNKYKLEYNLASLQKCEKLYNSHKDEFILKQIDYSIEELYGDMYFENGNYDSALEHHKKALAKSYAYEVGYTITAHKRISADYEKLDNYKEAFIHMQEVNKYLTEVEKTGLIKLCSNTQRENEKLKDRENCKNDFFAALSHELKTPINVMYSSIQLMKLLKESNSENFNKYYIKHEKSVKQNCLRMLKLIDNIIDSTKIGAGTFRPSFVNYDIVNLVEEITLSVLSSVEVKDINIIFDTEMEEEYIKCDPYIIERIMLNLLSNAIKFSKESGTILVYMAKSNGYISIEVKDDGVGIPCHMKDKIFDKYVQVDKSLKRKREGSGIGLSLVKALVDMHDGHITVESTEGEGTTFKVLLPNMNIKEVISKDNKDKHDISIKRVSTELSDIYMKYN